MTRLLIKKLQLIALFVMVAPGVANAADPGDPYCFKPAFISEQFKPNLLLMIDNSASMYDLGFVTGSTSTAPTYSCGTTSGITDSDCFDNTYSNTQDYEGYFSKTDPATGNPVYPVYQYINGKFEEITTGIPATTGTNIYRTSYLWISMTGTVPASGSTTPSNRAVETFIASGRFLNWLTASKLDIQKKILTGGKYASGALVSESRGCVGRRFVKVTPDLTAISFAVRGPNAVEPNYDSNTQGGETRIEIFEGTYNQSACQCAAYAWSKGTNYGDASTNTKTCLGTTPSDDALATLNHTQQTCFFLKKNIAAANAAGTTITDTVLWQGINTQDVKTACTNIYQDPKNPMPPSSITSESSGAYICTSAATHLSPVAPYNVNGSDSAGFVGKCWKDATDKFTGNDDCVKREILHYCMGVNVTEVTDPTNFTTSTTGSIPAILMDAGVRAIGSPVGPTGGAGKCSLRTTATCSNDSDCPKVCSNNYTTTCTTSSDCTSPGVCLTETCNNPFFAKVVSSAPTGLINEFSSTIRFGVMKFNDVGSKTEVLASAAFPTPPAGVTDLDGGVITSHIGSAVGDHSSGLIKAIDDVVARSWTPFAEAYYNAIAYFVKDATATTPTLSATEFTPAETAIKTPLTGTDSYTNKNPIQYRCQQNNILIVTDGSSTADRNEDMRTKVTDVSGQFRDPNTTTEPNTCGTYSGSPYLHDLSYHARNRNIFNPSEACAHPGTCENAQTIMTHVVFNGKVTSDPTNYCDPYTLMSKTALNGGTTIKTATASNYGQLKTEMRTALESIAVGASSGTAASILSNSEGSGANILQAVFFPKKVFEAQTEVNWIGEMQNLWYFVDPLVNRSTIREDTNQNKELNLIQDKVTNFRFDSTDNNTYAYLTGDTNGDGAGDTAEVKFKSDDVLSVWRAGRQLFQRPLTGVGARPRKIKTTLNGTSLIEFSSATFKNADQSTNNAATLAPYLDLAEAEAPKLIDYVHGVDQTGYRSRVVSLKIPIVPRQNPVTYTTASGTWRLGDIISSTPRIQSSGKLNGYNLTAPSGYSDASYASFIGSSNYKNRGMAYVGANDGMLHAFNFGLLNVEASGAKKASLAKVDVDDPALGEEMWAYIPKSALPYLKYYADPAYNHLYYVDGATLLFDASIGAPNGIEGCSAASYWNCTKPVSVVDGEVLDSTKNPWRSILIGGMGLGGASSKTCTADSDCVATPISDPVTTSKGFGYSSYFALDVTDPKNPSLLWEFNNNNEPGLGFSTTGAAIVRVGDRSKNGRWFAVFGSGPTGPVDVDNNQFKGRSNQDLKFFVVDLATGALVETIDTDIEGAFAGSMIGGAIDTDRWNQNTTGNYQDDVILAGYTQKVTGTPDTWTKGGVIRIVTKESTDPADWTWSKIIEDVGPVTTAISRLQDRKNKKLWYYFGTGRYYFRAGTDIDDYNTRRAIYGIKDPCYTTANTYDDTCGADDIITTTGITNQTTSVSTTIGAGGWKIDLDEYSTSFGAERVVTDAVALTNGTVFLTSFAPTSDPCGFGGNSYLWGLDYDTGGRPDDAALAGKALIQLSTGEFKEVNLAEAFGSGATPLNRRTSVPMTGKPPADAFPIVTKSNNKPVKKIMHIQER